MNNEYSYFFTTSHTPPPATAHTRYPQGFIWLDLKNAIFHTCISCTENLSPLKGTDKYVLTWIKINDPSYENRINNLEEKVKLLEEKVTVLKIDTERKRND